MQVSASIGFVQIDNDTASDESVMIDADRLMYEEKRAQGFGRDDPAGSLPAPV